MRKLKKIFIHGLALAIPLAIVAYVFLKIIKIFEKIIGPLASRLGIEHLLGELTLTILAIISILVLMLLLGMLMQLAFIAAFRKELEELILKFLPWLNQLKMMAADTLDLENVSTTWKPVLLYHEHCYNLAFMVDESEKLASFYVLKGIKREDGEMLTIEKEQVCFYAVHASEIRNALKQFGNGIIALAEKYNGAVPENHLS
jgi:uncharacterized membrane protein